MAWETQEPEPSFEHWSVLAWHGRTAARMRTVKRWRRNGLQISLTIRWQMAGVYKLPPILPTSVSVPTLSGCCTRRYTLWG